MDSPDFLRRLYRAIAAAERIEGLPEPQPVEKVHLLPALTPCRSVCDIGGAVVVKYLDNHDPQHAFNIVATLLPEGVKLRPESQGGPRWVWLETGQCDKSDPTGQAGYIGAKWSRKLLPGEFIARAKLHGETRESVTFQDIVVTRETMPQLRASGKYAEIYPPKDVEAHGGGSGG